jgi:hypothetical protein
MEVVEKKDNNLNSELEQFRNEIQLLVQREIDASRNGQRGSVHFIIPGLQKGETNFNARDLTIEDMTMYYRIKNQDPKLAREEFMKYKKSIFSETQSLQDLNHLKSRQMFAAYLSNLILEKGGKIIFIENNKK